MATAIVRGTPFPNLGPASIPIFGQRSGNQTNEDTDIPQENPPYRTPVPLHTGTSRSWEDTTQRDYREGQSIRHPDENPTNEFRQRMDDEARARIEAMTEEDWEKVFEQWTEKDIFAKWEKELE